MNKLALRALLFDFYGPLLTAKQKGIYDLYYQQDFSLGEIAAQQNVSRQAIFDILKRTDEALHEYEKKLKLVAKYQWRIELIGSLKTKIQEFTKESIAANGQEIRELFEKLENSW